jgi:AAA+ superfamily predicted ATPase
LPVQEDAVVLALRAAIQRTDTPALRLALGSHLVQAGRATEALEELEAGLRLDAADADLLLAAAGAAAAAGHQGKSTAYRLAAGAAPGAGTTASAPEPAAPPTALAPGQPPATRAGAPPVQLAPPQPPTSKPAPAPGDVSLREGRTGAPHLRVVASDGEIEEDVAPTVTFTDVGGMDDVKVRLGRAFLQPLKNPSIYRKYGKNIGGGLVLYGPPGCGKTFVARAVAGEIGARFMSVGLNDVLDMWLGESERKLHEIFENARRRAPALVFLDEIDALGQRRTHLKHSAGRNVVNQLLAELDGIGGRNEGVFFLAATNHPWDLDPALRRPGRFDRLLFVPPPDIKARAEILALKMRERPVGKVDLARLAKATHGFSGADLAAVVDAASDLAIEKSLSTQREVALDDALLHAALKDVRPSTRPWFETARNYAVYSNEGGSYDELLEFLRQEGLA